MGARESHADTGVLNMVVAWVQALPCDGAHSSVVSVVAGMVLALSH